MKMKGMTSMNRIVAIRHRSLSLPLPLICRYDLQSTPSFFMIPSSYSSSFASHPTVSTPCPTPSNPRVLTTTPPSNGIYLSAIDQGTTSTRFIVFDTHGQMIALHQVEFAQYHPHAGWTEQDPLEILSTVHECIEKTVHALTVHGLDPTMIKSIGITNQRETTVAWDADTGQPLYRAIVWHDTRSQPLLDQLIAASGKLKDAYVHLTGLPLNTYFSASKMMWMLHHVPSVQKARERGTLRFGTMDSWLLYCLSGGAKHHGVYVTDFTNASRTLLMDLQSRTWSSTMLDLFSVPPWTLPTIMPSSHVYATVHSGSLAGVPLAGNLGDQQAALVGQQCFRVGEAKNTYGTGCFLLLNTGTTPIPSQHGLLTTAGYDIPKLGPPVYTLEGSIAAGGATVKFLRDNMKMIDTTQQVNQLANQVDHTGGVYFVPAFSGLYAPHWCDTARGVLVGLTSYTDRRHICRAVLESVGFQTYDVIKAMNKDLQQPLTVIKVDGGMTHSDLAMQLQANIAGIPVHRPAMRETTALGAAIAAGLSTEALSVQQLESMNTLGADTFVPQGSEETRQQRIRKWNKAVKRAFDWVDEDDVALESDEVIVEH